LVDAKTPLHYQDASTGKSYLHMALDKTLLGRSCYSIVKLLVESRAPFDLKDKLGATPMMLDCDRNLKIYFMLQLLKKYLQLDPIKSDLKFRHLAYILQKEQESKEGLDRTDWGRVLGDLSQMIVPKSTLSASSIFSHASADLSLYTEMFKDKSGLYEKITEGIHRFEQCPQEVDLKRELGL
jgi:ankyrin repeat protein